LGVVLRAAVTCGGRRVESREAFSVWVCEQHNLVNEKIGKPPYKCDLVSVPPTRPNSTASGNSRSYCPQLADVRIPHLMFLSMLAAA
jgi:hypothetical protein